MQVFHYNKKNLSKTFNKFCGNDFLCILCQFERLQCEYFTFGNVSI